MSKTVLSVLGTVLAATVISGCGATSNDAESASRNDGSRAQVADDSRSCSAEDVVVSGAVGSKPDVTLPKNCVPSQKLIVKDLTSGTGPAVKSGDTATVNYLLKTWSDGQILDNSFDRGKPYSVRDVGQAEVIEGWNKGLIGLKKGARRLLIVPPKLGYGDGGQGIKPNETLVFVIDGVSVASA